MAATNGHVHGPECMAAEFASVTLKPSLQRPIIPMSLHEDNRARLVAKLQADGAPAGAVVLLQGGETDYRHETDHEKTFRQESFFAWAFGVKEPDCFGSIDVGSGRATLFIPRLPEAYAVWMGAILTPEQWKGMYAVDDVRYTDEMVEALRPASSVLLLSGFNTDGKRHARPAEYPGLDSLPRDTDKLWPAITECRVYKSTAEVEVLKYAAAITSEAHIATMQQVVALVKAGKEVYEFQLESLFKHWCYYYGGCRHVSYTCICASGGNGAVLHYGHAGAPNSKQIKEGDLCLFDMGSEYHCYGADITTSFPASGTFSPDQKIVYNAVLDAVKAVEDAMKPGVAWTDMHALAYRRVLTHLRDGGLLKGDVEAMMAVNLGSVFMPHGLGHFLGIDTHDVGGYGNGAPARPTQAGFASLRTTRTLEAGMYLTVEPGCYFIDVLLDAALADPARACFMNGDVIARFRGTGGVRIEDDVLVTRTGCLNLTQAPREIAEIEAACAGKITSISEVTRYH